jgi:hypothetical protein
LGVCVLESLLIEEGCQCTPDQKRDEAQLQERTVSNAQNASRDGSAPAYRIAEAGRRQSDLEADTTYVGGKPRNKQHRRGPRMFEGKKMPVFTIVERGGNIRSFATADVSAKNLGRILKEHADLSSHLMTDSGGVFKYSVGKPFAHHDMTNHHKDEYARDGFIHSNTAESVFSLLKRGIYGTFHNVSRKHLHR